MKTGIKEIIKAAIAYLCSTVVILGYYPLLPAYFAVCNTSARAGVMVMGACVCGMVFRMSPMVMLKYLFVLAIITIGTMLYRRINKGCGIWEAGAIAGVGTVVMNMAANGFRWRESQGVVAAISEGIAVMGLAVMLQWIGRIPYYVKNTVKTGQHPTVVSQTVHSRQAERMESLATAVNGLSDAFFAMSRPKEHLVTDEVGILEQELTGKLCGACESCAVCWNENRMKRQGAIRAMLYAVVNHSGWEHLIDTPYVEDCVQYETMVEEALQAFGRLELNHAWLQRLQENRYVIAKQLDAMAGLMTEWANSRVSVDKEYRKLLEELVIEVEERGLVIEDTHLYADNGRLCVEAVVSTKWDGSVPMRTYINTVEKVVRKAMRPGRDCRSLLTSDGCVVSLYEDTRYYGLQGISTRMKNGSMVNGDNYAFFAMDDGNYHVCLSDGMGSGIRAKQESEMVVDLLQKFIEAGFRKETAIQMMNSAMVLQGENDSYSTLDYGVVDMYTGQLELIKIGGAATYIKHGQEVSFIDEGTLPAGADPRMEIEPVKKQLQSGDFLVMVTDGVIEYLHVRNPKETLGDIIAMIQTDNAGVLAESIMEQVMMRTGGYALDDMTVLVTGIWEKK